MSVDLDIKNLIAQIKDARNKNIAVIAAVLAVALVIDVFFILLPLTAKNFRLKSQIVAIRKDMGLLSGQAADISSIKNRLEAAKIEQRECEKRLPKEDEVSVIIGGISAIAGKAGVEMIAVKPVKLDAAEKPSAEDKILHEVPIEIFAKGGYHQIGQFINKLESLDKFVEIKDIEITADKATPRRHFFRLLVSTYILRT